MGAQSDLGLVYIIFHCNNHVTSFFIRHWELRIDVAPELGLLRELSCGVRSFDGESGSLAMRYCHSGGAVSRGYRRNVPKGTATVAVQYREDTAETSGETNFSGVHKEAVQPRLRCSSLGEPISNRWSKKFVQAGPRAPAREFLTRNNNLKINN